MFGLQFTARMLLLSVCLLLFGKAFGHEQGSNYQKVVVPEGSDAVLPCSIVTKENIELKVFDWKKPAQKDEGRKEVFLYEAGKHYNNGRGGQSEQFKGRVSHFPDELKHGNASITIRDTKLTDSGNYTCVFPHVEPRQEFHIELVVEPVYKDRTGHKAATPKPSVTTLNATAEQALLQCNVPGASLKSKAEWRDSAGNTLPAEKTQVPEGEDHYCITLITTVNRTDHYRCVVEQEDIKHRVDAQTFVFVSAATPKPSVTTLNATAEQALLQCKVPGASLKSKAEWRDSAGNTLPAEKTQVPEGEDHYCITLITTVNRTDHYRCVVEQEDIKHRVDAQTFVFVSEKVSDDSRKVSSGWMVATWVLLAFLVVAVAVAVAVVVVLERAKFITITKGSRLKGKCSQGIASYKKEKVSLNPETESS